MNRSVQILVALNVICLILFSSPPLLAQEWSKAQKEVWKNVETYNELLAKGDVDGFLSYFHDDYSGWTYDDALPSCKATAQKWISYFVPKTEVMVYDIKPAAIKIHGDIAIVHYFYSRAYKNIEGNVKYAQGRWTDILMKQGDKWVLIGDHGGPTSEE